MRTLVLPAPAMAVVQTAPAGTSSRDVAMTLAVLPTSQCEAMQACACMVAASTPKATTPPISNRMATTKPLTTLQGSVAWRRPRLQPPDGAGGGRGSRPWHVGLDADPC